MAHHYNQDLRLARAHISTHQGEEFKHVQLRRCHSFSRQVTTPAGRSQTQCVCVCRSEWHTHTTYAYAYAYTYTHIRARRCMCTAHAYLPCLRGLRAATEGQQWEAKEYVLMRLHLSSVVEHVPLQYMHRSPCDAKVAHTIQRHQIKPNLLLTYCMVLNT